MIATSSKRTNVKDCGIVNVNSNVGEGTYWTEYIKDCEEIINFESYGNIPSLINIIKYGSNSNVKYNSDSV